MLTKQDFEELRDFIISHPLKADKNIQSVKIEGDTVYIRNQCGFTLKMSKKLFDNLNKK